MYWLPRVAVTVLLLAVLAEFDLPSASIAGVLRTGRLLLFSSLGALFFAPHLSNSGAFEVLLNGKVIFSKLEMNRFPKQDELVKIVGDTIKSSGKPV
jgi:selT/selW/selH-like putative selenoprotein